MNNGHKNTGGEHPHFIKRSVADKCKSLGAAPIDGYVVIRRRCAEIDIAAGGRRNDRRL